MATGVPRRRVAVADGRRARRRGAAPARSGLAWPSRCARGVRAALPRRLPVHRPREGPALEAAPAGPRPTGLLVVDPLRAEASSNRILYLLDAVRQRPGGRRALAALAVVLFVAGAGLVLSPLLTDVYARQLVQRPLADQFATPAFAERFRQRQIETGDPLTRIMIPAIAIETVVVEGTSPAALRAGAGHYPTTPLPGERGNVAIAGHRTTYGRPFNRLDEVPVGAEVVLETPIARHTYRVVAAPPEAGRPCPNGACWITSPTDWGVVGTTPTSMLTLTTCHPKGSAAERLILRAELVDTVDLPVGGGG